MLLDSEDVAKTEHVLNRTSFVTDDDEHRSITIVTLNGTHDRAFTTDHDLERDLVVLVKVR